MNKVNEAKELLQKFGYKISKESINESGKILADIGNGYLAEDDNGNYWFENNGDVYHLPKDVESIEEAKEYVLKNRLYESKINEDTIEEIVDDNLSKAIEELADVTGNDLDEAEIDEGSEFTNVTFGSEEYFVFNSYDAAEEYAKESVKSLIDDCGGVLKSGIRFENLGGIEQYIDTDAIEDIIRETQRDYLEEMDEEELEAEYNETDIDDILDTYMESINNPVEYIKNEFGEETLQNMIDKGQVGFDIDELAADVVNTDGPANSIASYDGEEIELDNGYYAYRVN